MKSCAAHFFACTIFFVSLVSSACASDGANAKLAAWKDKIEIKGKNVEIKVDKKVDAIRSAGETFSKAFEDIPPEDEYYIGRSVAANILTNYKIYSNVQLERYLNSICQTLVLNSEGQEPYKGFHVVILDSDEVNAFATSGGHILVTRGLIGCTSNEDSLAAVIAHEIGHIKLKHGLKAIKNSRFMDASHDMAVAITQNPDKKQADVMDGMVDDVMSQMVNSGYSQKQEFEADSYAVNLMYASGYAPSAIITMLELIDKNQKGSVLGMYKTHPSPKSRITNVKASMGKNQSAIKVSNARTNRYNDVMKAYAGK